MPILEVCIDTPAAIAIAATGGAERIKIVRLTRCRRPYPVRGFGRGDGRERGAGDGDDPPASRRAIDLDRVKALKARLSRLL